MFVKVDIDFNYLLDNCWSGAEDTIRTIYNAGKEDAFMVLLEETFSDDIPELVAINDFLRFDSGFIYEALGIKDEEDEEEDEKVSFQMLKKCYHYDSKQ